ncbi:MAG: hypothetical protein RL518_1947 [Pseudomonadota bacterium]
MLLQGESSKNKRKRANLMIEELPDHAAMSDIGLERVINEDRCSVISTKAGVCFLVLDGMGGAEGGEYAAQSSVDIIQRYLTQSEHPDLVDALRNALTEANQNIVFRRQNPLFKEMGTTIVCALIEGSVVAISHVGDSRAYLLHGDEIRQLTVDHTYVQHLVDQQEIAPEDALPHPQSHILTRCLGSSADLVIDVDRYWIWPLEDGTAPDLLLLCTDGLYSLIEEEEISRVVRTLEPSEACQELIRIANDRGGFDNITVSIIPLFGHLRKEELPTQVEHTVPQEQRRRASWWQRSLIVHVMLACMLAAGASLLATGIFLYFKVFGGF